MANDLTKGISKIVLASFQEPVTNRVLVFPSPSEFTWNFGFEQQEILQTDDLGQTYAADIVTTAKNPQCTLTYGTLTKELLALKTGYKLATQADVGVYARSLQVKQATYAAVTTGQDGFGMVADVASASVLRNGVSVPLTRQAFAGFTGSTADTFAQGASATFKFSDNLVTSKEWVTLYAEYPVTDAQVLTEDLFDTFKVSLIGLMHDKTVFNIIFDPVVLSRADSNEVNFGADTQDITFRITDPACVPTIRFINRARQC